MRGFIYFCLLLAVAWFLSGDRIPKEYQHKVELATALAAVLYCNEMASQQRNGDKKNGD